MTEQNFGITAKVFDEQMAILEADEHRKYLEEKARLLESENPQLNRVAGLFSDPSLGFIKTRLIGRVMYNMIKETHGGVLPRVSKEVSDSEMAKFRAEPVDYVLTRFNDYIDAQYNHKEGQPMDFTYLYALQGFLPDSFKDGLAIGALYLGMLNSQQSRERGLGDESRIVTANSMSELEKLCHANSGLGDFILFFADKSYDREKVIRTGFDICSAFGNMPHIGEEALNSARKNFMGDDAWTSFYTLEGLQKLFGKRPDICRLVCERALPKIPEGKTPGEMINLFFDNISSYYREMGEEKAREEAFKVLHKKYRKLFATRILNLREESDVTDEYVEGCVRYPVLFEAGNEGVVKQLLKEPEARKVFKTARKYPEYFDNCIDFFAKYRKLSKMYDLEKAFKGAEYQYKLLGNLAPVEEVLMLGASIGHIVDGGQVNKENDNSMQARSS